MSPTNLGQLPTNQPAPSGLCQIKRGVTDNVINYTNVVPAQAIHDGTGAPMRISITPARAGWWVIRAEAIWDIPDAIWAYWHWGVRLVPLDADGRGDDRNHVCQHSALSWNEHCIVTAYRLNANTAYYAEMYWPCSSSGYNNRIWSGKDYTYIFGEFIEDGSL